MKPRTRAACATLLSMVISLLLYMPAMAFPPLPSSFYGTVQVNAANVPDGTSVQALIGSKVYAETVTQTYQGKSVYSLNVDGDDTETSTTDGGREGDTIQFKIGGMPAVQTGVWHSGTNVSLDLIASTSTPVSMPNATITQVPTPTALLTLESSAMPVSPLTKTPPATTVEESSQESAAANHASSLPASPAGPSQAATPISQPTVVYNSSQQPPMNSTRSENQPGKGSGRITAAAVMIMAPLVVMMIIGYVIMAYREKKI
jgi:hypothetical protein